MKIQVRQDGSVSIVVKDNEEYLYLRAPQRFFVTEFEVQEGVISNIKQRPLR